MVHRWVGALVGLALVGLAGPGNASLYEDDVVCEVAGDSGYACESLTGGIVVNDVEFYVVYGSTPTLSLDLYESSVEISFMGSGSVGSLEIYLGDMYWTDYTSGYIEYVYLGEGSGINGLYGDMISLYPDGHSLTIDLSGISYSDADTAVLYFEVYHDEVEVSEPSSLALFGIGLAGLGFLRRRRKLT